MSTMWRILSGENPQMRRPRGITPQYFAVNSGQEDLQDQCAANERMPKPPRLFAKEGKKGGCVDAHEGRDFLGRVGGGDPAGERGVRPGRSCQAREEGEILAAR